MRTLWTALKVIFLGLFLGGCRSIHTAVNENDTEAARLILARRADLANAVLRDPEGIVEERTPLIAADSVEMVKLLLSYGADPFRKYRTKPGVGDYLAIHNAAMKGHADIVALYLDLGIDVNVRDDLGRTPLILAAANGKSETVQLLLEGGADITIVGQRGKTALECAESNYYDGTEYSKHHFDRTLELLRRHGAQ